MCADLKVRTWNESIDLKLSPTPQKSEPFLIIQHPLLLHPSRQAGLEPTPLAFLRLKKKHYLTYFSKYPFLYLSVFELDVTGLLLVAVVVLHVAVIGHSSPEEGATRGAGLSRDHL